MRLICQEVPGCHLANIVEGGLTPNLDMKQLADIGYQFAVYPLTLLSASMQAMKTTLALMAKDLPRNDGLMDFDTLKQTVGFNEYYEASAQYESAHGNRLSAGCAQKNLHEKSPSDTSARAFIFI